MYFEMVVGINLDGGEEVLVYIDFNIVYIEEIDIVGNGIIINVDMIIWEIFINYSYIKKFM